MRNNFLHLSLVATCLLIPSLVFAQTPKAPKTKIVFSYEDKNNFPFYMDEGTEINWNKPGVSVEFLKLLENYLNVEIRFVRQPWNRCKMSLSTGLVDGIFNASFKRKRMEIGAYPMKGDQVDPSRRITTIAYVLYKPKDSQLIWDKAHKKTINLAGEICAPLGYSIVDDLKAWKIPVYERDTTHTCFKIASIRKKRFAAIAALELAGDYYLSKNQTLAESFVKVQPPLVEKPYYLMLSHQFVEQHAILSEEIWDTIAKIRSTELKKILVKYF